MSAAKAVSAHIALAVAALSVFFGAGLVVNTIAGYPVEELEAWSLMWAGTSSIALALTLATYVVEITAYLESVWTPTPRGRHAR